MKPVLENDMEKPLSAASRESPPRSLPNSQPIKKAASVAAT